MSSEYNNKDYIYVYNNVCFDSYIFKIGTTRYPQNRLRSYKTYYPNKGDFVLLYELNDGLDGNKCEDMIKEEKDDETSKLKTI